MAATIHDIVAKSYKDTPFPERAKEFEQLIKPICEKLGVAPWAGLQTSQEAIVAVPLLRDLWAKP